MKSWLATFDRLITLRHAGLLVFAVLGMLLALSAWRSVVDTRSASKHIQTQALSWVQSTAKQQQVQLQQAQTMLQVLSGISVARPRNAASCNAFLARQLDRFPQYTNLAFADTQGAVWCRAKPTEEALSLPLMRTLQKPLLLPLAGHQLGFALPQFSADGRWQGSVFAVLPVADFFQASTQALPPGSYFSVVNAKKQRLLTYPATTIDAPTNNREFWLVTQPLVGTAEALQLQLHLPIPVVNRALYWGLLVLLILGAFATWRLVRLPQVQAYAGQLLAKLLPLLPLRKNPAPSNTQLLRGAYAELKGAFMQKEARVQQLVQLDELSQRLQTCANSTEWADTVARCAQAIYPTGHGALYLHVNNEHFGLALAWGGSILNQTLKIHDCHALHSNRTYVSHSAKASACAHAVGAENYVCIPLTAFGQPSGPALNGAMGLLFLAHLPAPGKNRTAPWAATAIAERASIGLSTLRRQEQLQRRAIRDALTGLFNRGFMEETLDIEQQRALRQDACIGIMMLDVDHFKRYNDSFGHAAGDTLLRGIGKLIQRSIRDGDIPCRYGGEEFVLILPGADLVHTQKRAETLRLAIEHWQPESADGNLGQVTVSIGVATFPTHGNNWQSVLKRADQALYAAKHGGRNRVELAVPEFEDTLTA